MSITRDMNSFDVFHLGEDATESEIKSALKFHVDMYCGEDGNKKNEEGEYLLNIYRYHFKKLMDPVEKEKLIEEKKARIIQEDLGKNDSAEEAKNELLVSTISHTKQNYIITSLNQEIVQKYSNTYPKIKFSLQKKVSLRNVYVVIGADCSLMFAKDTYSGHAAAKGLNEGTGKIEQLDSVEHYALKECFTGQNIFGNIMWAWFEIPWSQGQIFRVNGILSTAILSSKIFPHELIHNGKIRDCDFRRSYDIIHDYLHKNSEYISSVFENVDEEEVNKRMQLEIPF